MPEIHFTSFTIQRKRFKHLCFGSASKKYSLKTVVDFGRSWFRWSQWPGTDIVKFLAKPFDPIESRPE